MDGEKPLRFYAAGHNSKKNVEKRCAAASAARSHPDTDADDEGDASVNRPHRPKRRSVNTDTEDGGFASDGG